MSERAAFIRAIAEQPDDDVRRLAFADWLDEQPATVPCPGCSGYADDPCPRCDGKKKVWVSDGPYGYDRSHQTCPECHGTGTFPPGYRPARDPASGREEGGWTNCKVCNSGGAGPYCGVPGMVRSDDADRAAFIRYQFGLACRTPRGSLDDWIRVPCTAGEGHKRCSKGWTTTAETQDRMTGGHEKKCETCDGTGDAGGLTWRIRTDSDDAAPQTAPPRVDWARGFPHRVHCRLSDVCERELLDPKLGLDARLERYETPYGPWRPTAFALAVVTHHPVSEFRVNVPFTSTVGPVGWEQTTIPEFLFGLLFHNHPNDSDGAHMAMAQALAAWVRSYVAAPA